MVVVSAVSMVPIATVASDWVATVALWIDSPDDATSIKLRVMVSDVVFPAWIVTPVNDPSSTATSLKRVFSAIKVT